MRSRPPLAPVFALAALALAAPQAWASWPHDPFTGTVPVCTATGEQSSVVCVADGAGGASLARSDVRGGATSDVYVQHLDAEGSATWTANGVPLCTLANDQFAPQMVSDGAGGVIVVWTDYRDDVDADLYAQRVGPSGSPLWTLNGVAVCALAGDQSNPAIVADGAGGAIVAWQDTRLGPTADIIAQHLSSIGAATWTAGGVVVCGAIREQVLPVITPDAAGGAVIAWQDNRYTSSGLAYDTFSQRLDAAGAALWAADGVPLCVQPNSQNFPAITSDGAGGAIVAWADFRSGSTSDLYAQRASATGLKLWTVDGLPVCTAADYPTLPANTSDGAEGAIVVWEVRRNGDFDIFGQRVLASGSPTWVLDGRQISSYVPRDQFNPAIVPDGSGGALVAWTDDRDANRDIYARRVTSAGSTLWTLGGVAVSMVPASDQQFPEIASEGADGAILVWQDGRSGNSDLFAQRIERYGNLGNREPVLAGVADVPADQGGWVSLSWDASYLDADPVFGVAEYRIFRSVPVAGSGAAPSRRAIPLDSDVASRTGALLAVPAAGGAIV